MESITERRVRLARNTRVYRQRHPERVRLADQRMKRERRLRVFALLGGPICHNCGCDELSFLELNHKNGGGSKDFRQIGNHLYDLLLNGKRDPKDYEVLCRVCNAVDHLQRKIPEKASYYQVTYTGQKTVKLNGNQRQ